MIVSIYVLHHIEIEHLLCGIARIPEINHYDLGLYHAETLVLSVHVRKFHVRETEFVRILETCVETEQLLAPDSLLVQCLDIF